MSLTLCMSLTFVHKYSGYFLRGESFVKLRSTFVRVLFSPQEKLLRADLAL